MNVTRNICLCLVLTWTVAAQALEPRQVIGWIEKAEVIPGKLVFIAKLDTGSIHSSVNAENIHVYERDGQPWVRFDIVNRDNERRTLDLPQAKSVTIKRQHDANEQRPAVMLGICLDTVYKEVLVSLTNRREFLYDLLIGRNFMRRNFAIDPSRRLTTEPRCPITDDE